MRLYLVRHGETVWNQQSKFQGWADKELSEKGIAQARDVKEQLKNIPFDAAYSSSLQRSRRTAEIIVEDRDMEVTPIFNLREHGIGELDGLIEREIREQYPGVLETMRDNPANFKPPGGETLQEVQDRTWPEVLKIAEKHEGETVLLVAHHSVNKAIILKMLDTPLSSFRILRQPPCTVSILEIRGELQYVHAVNLNWQERVSPWHDLPDSLKNRIRDPRAVIFDMDGVLIDSMPYYTSAWRSALAEWGVLPREAEIYRREGEKGTASILHYFTRAGLDYDDETGERVLERVYEIYRGYPQPKAMDGALDLVKKIRQSGRKVGLVTGSPRADVDALIDGAADLFDIIVTSSDVERGKPHPDPYLQAIDGLGLPAEQIIAVENAPFGVRSARAAALLTVAVTTTLPREELIEADIVIDGLRRLEGWIEL